ncbi:MAG TPA: DUF3592 domain-containing protein, partial [Kofleriaceae bacterium]|nr:DUF3592 domain-containing protein [Kofleriaceae bacterium]
MGLALGIAFVFGGAYWAYTKHEWAQHAGHADGTVIATPHGGAHPEVAYNTPEGGYQNKPMSDITNSSYDGEHVHVLYDRKQPSSAELDSWPNLYLFATIF